MRATTTKWRLLAVYKKTAKKKKTSIYVLEEKTRVFFLFLYFALKLNTLNTILQYGRQNGCELTKRKRLGQASVLKDIPDTEETQETKTTQITQEAQCHKIDKDNPNNTRGPNVTKYREAGETSQQMVESTRDQPSVNKGKSNTWIWILRPYSGRNRLLGLEYLISFINLFI